MVDEKTEGQTKEILKTGPPFLMSRKGDRDERQNRECMKNGWVRSPEECSKEFGSVPKGALLFILEPVGAKTTAKFRNDGIGDVTHMGIVTGRGDGAIHSSKSWGGVATSKFKGKTIPNGGWNRVGLLDVFDYGTDKSQWTYLADSSETSQTSYVPVTRPSGKLEEQEEERTMKVIIQAENGGAVKLRQGKDPKKKEYSVWEEYPSGTKAEVLKHGETWSRIRVGNRTGWMMTEFLVTDDSGIPAEQALPESEELRAESLVQSEELRVESGDQVTLLAEVYRVLRDLCEKIDAVIGRG